MLRIESPLSAEEEAIVTRAIDCGYSVAMALGPGFREKIYSRAYCLELESRGIRFEREKRIDVPYKQWRIPGQTVDLIVEKTVLVELKAVPALRPIHWAQVRSYLKTAGLRVGLLMNFNSAKFKDGIRRIVLTT